MFLKHAIAGAIVALSLVAAPAQSATLVATSNQPQLIGSFSLTFTDANNNHLFDLGELVSFSGILSPLGSFEVITKSADISGISTNSDPGIAPEFFGHWLFYNSVDDGFGFVGEDQLVQGDFFDYRLTLDTPVVPIPAALPLLASVLASLGLLGWRRKRYAPSAT